MADEVYASQWTNEWRPTAPVSMSAREAAVAILEEMNWAGVLEEHGDVMQGDPLVYYGLRAELGDLDWTWSSRFPGRARSHLTAWVASRLVRRSWCRNDEHHDEMIPFDDCWGAQDDGDCMWDETWALDGDPDDFLRLAAHLLRDGWEPDDPMPNPAGHPLVGPAEMLDRGYVMEANRRFFHPLGLALAVDRERVNADGSFPVQVWDYRDDPEGFLFADLSDDDAVEKWGRVTDELGAKRARRQQVLTESGFVNYGPAVVQAIGSVLPPTREERGSDG